MEILPMGKSTAKGFLACRAMYLTCSRKRCALSSGSMLMPGMLAVPRTPAVETAVPAVRCFRTVPSCPRPPDARSREYRPICERGVALQDEWAHLQMLSHSSVTHKTYNGQAVIWELS